MIRTAARRLCASRPYTLPAWLLGRPGREDSAVHLAAQPGAPGVPVVLEPGLVVLRQALGRGAQRALAAEAWAAGSGQRHPAHSFYEADGSLRGPKGRRGRIFDACAAFDPRLTRLLLPACARWVDSARSHDSGMPAHEASHLLLLYYPVGGTLGFHRDEQANDGTGDEPIVNLTLGGEIDFAVRHEHGDVARVVSLRSGDVVLFGGACRKLLHAVVATRMAHEDVLPVAAQAGRLSFTLRHAPEISGHEHLYADFRPQADDPGRRPAGDERLLGRERARERLRAMTE